MIAYKYHVRTSGTLVSRGNETVLVKDGEQSMPPPPGVTSVFPIRNPDKPDQVQHYDLEDDWVGADWGEHEDAIWERFKEYGTEITGEEARGTTSIEGTI